MALFKNIPSSFNIFGHTIKVEIDKRLLRDRQAVGCWLPTENRILLQDSSKAYNISQDQLEQAFLHELTHCILEYLSEDDLNHDEKFVDLFAQALHQTLKSANYSKK